MPSVTLMLPIPPSVNHAYVPTRKGGRARGDEALEYERIVWATLYQEYPGETRPIFSPSRPLHVAVTLHVATRRRMDLDNSFKVLIDAMVRQLGLDDAWVDAIVARKVMLKGGRGRKRDEAVEITISQEDAA